VDTPTRADAIDPVAMSDAVMVERPANVLDKAAIPFRVGVSVDDPATIAESAPSARMDAVRVQRPANTETMLPVPLSVAVTEPDPASVDAPLAIPPNAAVTVLPPAGVEAKAPEPVSPAVMVAAPAAVLVMFPTPPTEAVIAPLPVTVVALIAPVARRPTSTVAHDVEVLVNAVVNAPEVAANLYEVAMPRAVPPVPVDAARSRVKLLVGVLAVTAVPNPAPNTKTS
jgi:hypothetical protein